MKKTFPRGVATLVAAGCLLPVFAKADVESKVPPAPAAPFVNPVPPDANDLAWAIASLPIKPGGTTEDPDYLSAHNTERYNTAQLAVIYVQRKIGAENFAALLVAHGGDCARSLKMLDGVQVDCEHHHGASVARSVSLTRAEVYYLMHDTDRAIKAYEASGFEYSGNVIALLHYALLLHQVHRDSDAIEYNQKVVDIFDRISWGPREPDWKQEFLVDTDDLKAGKLEYEANLLLSYQDRDHHFYKAALSAAREALRLRPALVTPHFNLGSQLATLYMSDASEWHTPAVFAEATKELQTAQQFDAPSFKKSAESCLRLLQSHDKPAPSKSDSSTI